LTEKGRAKIKKYIQELKKFRKKSGCSIVCDAELDSVIKSHYFLYGTPEQRSVTAY
jgi:hypothetical protein